MAYRKILILLLVVIATVISFQLQKVLRVWINPRKSVAQLVLFLVLSAVVVFALVFITAFMIIYFKDFFFKR